MTDDQTAVLIEEARDHGNCAISEHRDNCTCTRIDEELYFALADALERAQVIIDGVRERCEVLLQNDSLDVQYNDGMTDAVNAILDALSAEKNPTETKSLDAAHPGPSAAQAELGSTNTRPDEGAGPSESVRHAARRESRDAGDWNQSMTDKEINAIKARHASTESDIPECRNCGWAWPCDAALAVAEVERLRAALGRHTKRIIAVYELCDYIDEDREGSLDWSGPLVTDKIRAALASQRSEEPRSTVPAPPQAENMIVRREDDPLRNLRH